MTKIKIKLFIVIFLFRMNDGLMGPVDFIEMMILFIVVIAHCLEQTLIPIIQEFEKYLFVFLLLIFSIVFSLLFSLVLTFLTFYFH